MNNLARNLMLWVIVAIVLMAVFNALGPKGGIGGADKPLTYDQFIDQVRNDRVATVEIQDDGMTIHGVNKDKTEFYTYKPDDQDMINDLLAHRVQIIQSPPSSGRNILLGLLFNLLPIALLVGLFFYFLRQMQQGGTKGAMSFGRSRAKLLNEDQTKATFADVAGCDEAKEEVAELVEFLRDPGKFQKLGGKIPRGVLMVGPPGTGKTLLARAVAGEAGVPFFRMSGAEFVEMFVGVGAARVRDLFKQAREKAPCIVFIDELDAIGKSRVNGVMGGNDEREQTLNQLLVEMDGFDATSGLIILAATNRPDVLDPALLRPGRFDRQVGVDRPDIVGREAILDIHSKAVKLDPAADLKKVARATPGFVGADLANVVNEAALLAVRAGRKKVHQADFEKAVEKIMTGLEKKSRVMNPDERRVIAYHEAGHAIVAAFTPEADPVQKVSIVPRGFGALGFTLQVPIEDRYIVTEDKLLGEIDVLMGGRAAEELTFGKVSTGAANDITRATDIARRMITDYGMSERYRNVALTKRGAGMMGPSAEPVMAREYGEETQRYIDETVAATVAARYDIARRRLEERRALLDELAGELLEKESIDEAAFKAIVAPPAASEERLASS